MALMSAKQAEQVRQRLQAELAGDVTVRLFVNTIGGLAVPGRDCETCETTRQLLEEVAALDPRIRLQVHSTAGDPVTARALAIEHLPAVLIGRNGQNNLRYYGIPSGFEFAAFLDDLVAVSRGDSGLSAQTRAALASLQRDVHLKVFVTPTCPYCPKAARLAHAFAQESARIRADVYEAMEFPELAARYHVYGVPKVVINETGGFEGAQPEAAFLAEILNAA
ncbi:MAG: thioredoxin family protein [Armatimonadota bacterium]|nr:thioredoxin family protein [Armatimonadota bacterium]